jgi:hypothetical protein
MIVFPLSWASKIVLILIAIVLGVIFWGMVHPGFFRKLFGKKRYEEEHEKAGGK